MLTALSVHFCLTALEAGLAFPQFVMRPTHSLLFGVPECFHGRAVGLCVKGQLENPTFFLGALTQDHRLIQASIGKAHSTYEDVSLVEERRWVDEIGWHSRANE